MKSAGVIGTGKVGLSIAERLFSAGLLSFAAYHAARPRAESRGIEELLVPSEQLASLGSFPRYVFICVPDDRIKEVSSHLARLPVRQLKDTVFLHTSGYKSAGELSAIAAAGGTIAAAHPYQSFARASAGLLQGIAWGTEATDTLYEELSAFIREALEGLPVRLPSDRPELKTAYHASAAAASNLVAGAFRLSADLLSELGLPAEKMLPRIVGQVLRNTLEGEPALTGPIARGDLEAVNNHLKAIADPDRKKIYCLYSLATAELALAQGLISLEQHDELSRILKKPLL